jgi:hypothetical protein
VLSGMGSQANPLELEELASARSGSPDARPPAIAAGTLDVPRSRGVSTSSNGSGELDFVGRGSIASQSHVAAHDDSPFHDSPMLLSSDGCPSLLPTVVAARPCLSMNSFDVLATASAAPAPRPPLSPQSRDHASTPPPSLLPQRPTIPEVSERILTELPEAHDSPPGARTEYGRDMSEDRRLSVDPSMRSEMQLHQQSTSLSVSRTVSVEKMPTIGGHAQRTSTATTVASDGTATTVSGSSTTSSMVRPNEHELLTPKTPSQSKGPTVGSRSARGVRVRP